jgi:hypothetical protein
MRPGAIEAEYGVKEPVGIGIDEWIPQNSDIQEALKERGIRWAKVRESFPENTTTWIYIGGSKEEQEEPVLVQRD